MFDVPNIAKRSEPQNVLTIMSVGCVNTKHVWNEMRMFGASKSDNAMKPFKLSEYIKNMDKKVVTRDGREVLIRSIDFPSRHYKVLGFIGVVLYGWDENGKYIHDRDGNENDLFFVD